MPVINSIISMFSTKRLAQIDFFKENPIQVQRDTLVELLRRAADTEYGLKYDFDSILTAEQYRERLPIIHYEELAPYSERLMNGEQNLLWPEPITWFAKSSGTTAAKSKFIPVSKESLESCHFRGGKDVISIFKFDYKRVIITVLADTIRCKNSETSGAKIKCFTYRRILYDNCICSGSIHKIIE